MKSVFVFAITLAVAAFAHAEYKGLSAARLPNETFEQAYERHSPLIQVENSLSNKKTPVDLKKHLAQLDTSSIPDVGNYDEMLAEFKYIRDTRFMPSQMQNFPRRMTWLYPDDGCFARAELAADFLQLHKYMPPMKMFAFGNLEAKSDNSPYGRVNWWYHVAVTYKVGNEVYILDPALMPARPMTLKEWHAAIGGARANVQYTVCDTGTFDPDFACHDPDVLKMDEAQSVQSEYFDLEWERLLQLNRKPEQELGENPPWLRK